MRPVILLATNFAREQRWPLFFLLLWVLGWATFGAWEDARSGPDDSLLIFRQLALYSVTFGVFFGSSALQADQRSRRILTVLSKGISRTQYVGGLLLGIAFIEAVFCFCVGFTATSVLGRFGFRAGAIWMGMLMLWTACCLTASLALALATFLPPLFAAMGAGAIAGIPALLTLRGSALSRHLIPVYGLLEPLIRDDFRSYWRVEWLTVLLGWAETGMLLLAAVAIFSRRDLSATSD